MRQITSSGVINVDVAQKVIAVLPPRPWQQPSGHVATSSSLQAEPCGRLKDVTMGLPVSRSATASAAYTVRSLAVISRGNASAASADTSVSWDVSAVLGSAPKREASTVTSVPRTVLLRT